MTSSVIHFGRTLFRGDRRIFGIGAADRLFHMYLIGRTGVGKTSTLETMIRQDVAAGRGSCLIDPHGDLVERIAAACGRPDLVYFNAPDPAERIGFNPLRRVRRDKIALAASGLLDVFRMMWSDAWGVRMEHVLRNALFALIEYGQAKLPDILRLLWDKGFLQTVTARLSNDQVKAFWQHEYPRYSFRYKADAIAPIQNKVGAFLADPLLYSIFTEREDLRIRKIMDEGGVLLVNLAKGRLGSDSSNLLGGMLVTTIGLAAFSRADMPESERRPFFLYIDEFQNFTTLSVASMLSELRKYGVGMVLAHQNLHQLEPDVRHTILGNVGTLVAFRVGPEDATAIAREFEPQFDSQDLVNLPNHHFYVKLMIDGAPSRGFSATTLH